MIKKILAILFISLSMNLIAQNEESLNNFELEYVDAAPVAPGCSENFNTKELRECFARYVSNITAQNISMEFLGNQNLDSGKYKINILFKIDCKGRITDVSTNSNNRKIDKHFIKAIKSVKKMKPAILDNKPVNIVYTLPIKFQVE